MVLLLLLLLLSLSPSEKGEATLIHPASSYTNTYIITYIHGVVVPSISSNTICWVPTPGVRSLPEGGSKKACLLVLTKNERPPQRKNRREWVDGCVRSSRCSLLMFVSNYSDDTTETRSYTIESTAKTQALKLGGFVRRRRGVSWLF